MRPRLGDPQEVHEQLGRRVKFAGHQWCRRCGYPFYASLDPDSVFCGPCWLNYIYQCFAINRWIDTGNVFSTDQGSLNDWIHAVERGFDNPQHLTEGSNPAASV